MVLYNICNIEGTNLWRKLTQDLFSMSGRYTITVKCSIVEKKYVHNVWQSELGSGYITYIEETPRCRFGLVLQQLYWAHNKG